MSFWYNQQKCAQKCIQSGFRGHLYTKPNAITTVQTLTAIVSKDEYNIKL